MYSTIKNPKTGERVHINSRGGLAVLRHYISALANLKGGAASKATSPGADYDVGDDADVVVIGDIHGDYGALISCLMLGGLIKSGVQCECDEGEHGADCSIGKLERWRRGEIGTIRYDSRNFSLGEESVGPTDEAETAAQEAEKRWLRDLEDAGKEGEIVRLKALGRGRKLSKHSLENNRWQWVGGNKVVVILGDMVDRKRGSHSINPVSSAEPLFHTSGEFLFEEEIIQRVLNNLRAQARASGGKVIKVVGNHEIMNMTPAGQSIGDSVDTYQKFRYVTDFYKKNELSVVRQSKYTPRDVTANPYLPDGPTTLDKVEALFERKYPYMRGRELMFLEKYRDPLREKERKKIDELTLEIDELSEPISMGGTVRLTPWSDLVAKLEELHRLKNGLAALLPYVDDYAIHGAEKEAREFSGLMINLLKGVDDDADAATASVNLHCVVKIRNWIFLHGGLMVKPLEKYLSVRPRDAVELEGEKTETWKNCIQDIDQQFQLYMANPTDPTLGDFVELLNDREHGILWNRTFGNTDASANRATACDHFSKLRRFLDNTDLKMAVAHCVQTDAVFFPQSAYVLDNCVGKVQNSRGVDIGATFGLPSERPSARPDACGESTAWGATSKCIAGITHICLDSEMGDDPVSTSLPNSGNIWRVDVGMSRGFDYYDPQLYKIAIDIKDGQKKEDPVAAFNCSAKSWPVTVAQMRHAYLSRRPQILTTNNSGTKMEVIKANKSLTRPGLCPYGQDIRDVGCAFCSNITPIDIDAFIRSNDRDAIGEYHNLVLHGPPVTIDAREVAMGEPVVRRI